MLPILRAFSRTRKGFFVKQFGLLALALSLSTQAFAGETCSLESFQQLRNAFATQNNIPGVAISPAVTYNGLSNQAIVEAGAKGAGDFLNRQFNRFGVTAKAFIEAGGDINAAATKIFGSANRRQAIEIWKHAGTEASSTGADCSESSCVDSALEVTALHLVTGKSAQQVIETISAAKIATVKPAVDYSCVTSASCARKDQLAPGAPGVLQTQAMTPMRENTNYTVREIASNPIATIDNTSIYKIQSLSVCGHQAFLMSGVGTADANSFAKSSSDVLAVEAGGRILTVAFAQGIAQRGAAPQTLFLNTLPFINVAKKAKATVSDGYNLESGRLGTNETIGADGMLR